MSLYWQSIPRDFSATSAGFTDAEKGLPSTEGLTPFTTTPERRAYCLGHLLYWKEAKKKEEVWRND